VVCWCWKGIRATDPAPTFAATPPACAPPPQPDALPPCQADFGAHSIAIRLQTWLHTAQTVETCLGYM
jgi:hypothetical protein